MISYFFSCTSFSFNKLDSLITYNHGISLSIHLLDRFSEPKKYITLQLGGKDYMNFWQIILNVVYERVKLTDRHNGSFVYELNSFGMQIQYNRNCRRNFIFLILSNRPVRCTCFLAYFVINDMLVLSQCLQSATMANFE